MVELLRFDDHFDPGFLLLLQVRNDCLIVDQVFFVFGEILCTDVFNLLNLFVVSFIDIIIIVIDVFCRSLDVCFQYINLISLARENFIFKQIDLGPKSDSRITMSLTILVGIIRLVLFKLINPQSILILQFGQVVLREQLILKYFALGCLLFL